MRICFTASRFIFNLPGLHILTKRAHHQLLPHWVWCPKNGMFGCYNYRKWQ